MKATKANPKWFKKCPVCDKKYIEKRAHRKGEHAALGGGREFYIHKQTNTGTLWQASFGCVVRLLLIALLTAPAQLYAETDPLIATLEAQLTEPRCRWRGGFQSERFIWDRSEPGKYMRDGKVDVRASYDCTVFHIVRDADLFWLRLLSKQFVISEHALDTVDVKLEAGLMAATLLESRIFLSDRLVVGIDLGITAWGDFAIGVSPHYVVGANPQELIAWGTTFFISGNLSDLVD